MKKSLTIGVVIVLVIGGGYLVLNKDTVYKYPADSNNSTSVYSSELTKIVATITYSNEGFSPALTTIKAGDIVAVVNSSTSELQMESDPHPGHTDNSDLNVGLISAGESNNFTATKTGSFGFHNHLNPSDTAKITIE